MDFPNLHPWSKDTGQAKKLQQVLAEQVALVSAPVSKFQLVAGADVSSTRFGPRLYAAVVIWRLSDAQVVEEAFAQGEADFPYIPGLLSFRELPVVLEAFRRLTSIPDAVLADGQGLAHPRFLGLACHLGLWLNLPTVGCAKTRLVGEAPEPGPNRGDREPLLYSDRIVGAVLRTRTRCRPLYVSPGNLINLESSLQLVLACTHKARLPEPTRLAHLAVNSFRRNNETTL